MDVISYRLTGITCSTYVTAVHRLGNGSLQRDRFGMERSLLSWLRAARDRNMTDHEYHYFDMNAIRFPLSIMNIIIEYEFYYLNCTEPVVYIKAMN